MVTGVDPSPPRFLPSICIAHRVQQSHCSSIFHRVLLTHALALSASQFVHKKKSARIYTSMHSAGLELTKLTLTRLEVNLIRHRGDRLLYECPAHMHTYKRHHPRMASFELGACCELRGVNWFEMLLSSLPSGKAGKVKVPSSTYDRCLLISY